MHINQINLLLLEFPIKMSNMCSVMTVETGSEDIGCWEVIVKLFENVQIWQAYECLRKESYECTNLFSDYCILYSNIGSLLKVISWSWIILSDVILRCLNEVINLIEGAVYYPNDNIIEYHAVWRLITEINTPVRTWTKLGCLKYSYILYLKILCII